MKFNITVPVKPYVKRFLENNYGNPVDFRNHPRENEMFKRMLKKPNYDNDHKYKNEFCKQSHSVEIAISDRDFYIHGWEFIENRYRQRMTIVPSEHLRITISLKLYLTQHQ